MKTAALCAALFLLSCACTLGEPKFLQKAVSSTVTIRTDDGSGSGTVIYSSGGKMLVLTCHHVIDTAKTIAITAPGLGYLSAELIKFNETADLALLLVHGDLPAMKLAKKEPEQYERVYLTGTPAGVYGTMSEAFVSKKESLSYTITGGFLVFGISGGTALNSRGELVCVPNRLRSLTYPFQTVLPQLGFCVSLAAIKEFLREYRL